MKECIMGELCDCEYNKNGCKIKCKIDTLICPPMCNMYQQRQKSLEEGIKVVA